MALEEIEKLRLRVEKDPMSRLFLPLAEEYRKSGMLDEAISVLLRGLEHHPTYTSARVALGRLYLEKNMVQEAQAEFEEVVKAVAGNLFAHKKLADIYRDLGKKDKAASEYKTVLTLNPLDEDAKANLEAIEGKSPEQPAASFSPAERDITIEAALEKPVQGEAQEELYQDLEAFDAEEAVEEKAAQVAEPQFLVEEFEEFSKSLSQGDEGSAVPSEEAFELPSELHLEDAFDATYPQEDSKEASAAVDLFAVDSLIAGGDYAKAMNAYLGMLAKQPNDRGLLQRVAELRAYLKLIGKGKEIVIARLEAFQEGIKRRFDAESLNK
ncbi:MAG TPA: hypothetical protein DCP92_09050 [Nitrospiraceae bacterium]|nr:hypothetical protein [Nitrospiraceae bacterium]